MAEVTMFSIGMAFIKGIGAMIASSVLSSFFGEDEAQAVDYGFQANTQSMSEVIPVVYGQTRIGINRCYVGTSGTDNKYLHIIGILCEGEIEGWSDEIDGVKPVYFDDRLYTEFGADNVAFTLHVGSSTQVVDSTLHSAIPEWTDPLRYTAYIYVRLLFDSDKFQSVPNITVGIKGLKVYDTDTLTTIYSNNAALCTNNLMTRAAGRGGFGIATSKIDLDSVEDARAYCATKSWTCNMPISDNVAITDNIKLILNNFRGVLVKSLTKFYLRFKDLNEESVVMAFDYSDDRDIIDGSLGIKQPDLFNNPTAVNIEYISEVSGDDGESSYKVNNFIYSDPEIETDETYVELVVRCLGLSDLDTVQKMAYYYLERSKLSKTCSFIAGQKAASLEPLDLITLTHNLAGWIDVHESKVFRVLSVGLNSDYTVSLSCVEEHDDFYDDVYDSTLMAYHDTILPDPLKEPLAVSNVSLTEEVYYYRNRSFTRLLLDFTTPTSTEDPFFDYAEIYMKIGTDDYKHKTNSNGDYVVDPVDEGDTYYFKMKSVNIFGNKGVDENDVVIVKTIIGKTDVPSNLSSMTAAANGDSVSIYADPIDDPDIEGYEVRLGTVWDGAIFISFNKNCSLRLNGVRPGTHTFWMAAKDNAGNYAGTPVSATVTVFIPPGYTVLATGTWAWDFNAIGTHVNTQYIIYDSSDALRCKHAGRTYKKTSGSDQWGDAILQGINATINSAILNFYVSQVDALLVCGLYTAGSANLDAYWSLDASGICHIYENGAWVSDNGVYTDYTRFEIIYNGSTVVYKKGGVTVKTSTPGAGLTLVFYASLYTVGAEINSIISLPACPITIGSAAELLYGRLGGYWMSPTQDLAASETVRLWGDFRMFFASGDTTWYGVAPDPDTWDDLGADLSWNEIFEPVAAGVLRATLLHSTDSSTWSEIEYFEILCAEVEARYIKVKVEMIDPTLNSNLYLKELNMLAYEGPQ